VDVSEALAYPSPDETHEALRAALLAAIAEINDLTTRVTALEEA
jgi:hypothetical protein